MPNGNPLFLTGDYHASPTAVLSFGKRQGQELPQAGELNRGIEYMFIMMNAARLEIGTQELGLAEAAFQVSKTYAAERKQGKAIFPEKIY